MNGDIGGRDQPVLDVPTINSSIKTNIVEPTFSSPFLSVNSNKSINALRQISYRDPSLADLNQAQSR